MMARTFILYSHGNTDPNFDIDKSYYFGRLDLVCRVILSALWLSEKIRKDTQVLVSLNGGPNPPIALKFDGAKIAGIEPSEFSIAKIIKSALFSAKEKDWKFVHYGVFVSKKSFQDLVKESKNIWLLDAKGRHIFKSRFKEFKEITFVLGDNLGVPKNEKQFVLRKGEAISIGKNIYLASSVVSIVNWVLDQNVR
ncbi:MAG: tRNA (pseudouridine(54)-N(1))-methyltransferase TrmY [Candidatus Nanoarchaeia archaeon]